MEEIMLLKYKDFIIRNADEKDSKILETWWNDGNIMAHAGFPNGLGETSENIAKSLKKDTDYTNRTLIIEQGNIPIGEMCYRNIGDETAEIGIKICDFNFQNKGLGKILLSMLISSLFSDYCYKKIILDTNLNNKRAQLVYEKLGFRKLRVNYDAWKNQLIMN